MARQRSVVKVNQFIGGLNTEASPANYPLGATIDEQNCELLFDGSRRRRDGFDVGVGTPVTTPIEYPGNNIGHNQFFWKDAGGIPGKDFLAVQIGKFVGIHPTDVPDINTNILHSFSIPGASNTTKFDFSNVGGTLVIATGIPNVWLVEYKDEVFTTSQGRLKVRDLFGVEEVGYTEPQNIAKRPPSSPQTDKHIYNLRNQTFGRTIVDGNPNNHNYSTIDPISACLTIGKFQPSNADNLNQFRVPDPEASNNRTVERFDARSMGSNSPANMRAPMGMFIIDALQRGVSRRNEFGKLAASVSQFSWRPDVVLPVDTTPGGATVVAQYSGRVWFSGFSNELIGGDGASPRLASYLLFSQVVKDPSQIFNCYQFADPTSDTDADLVATDGGFLKVDEAFGIVKLLPVETSLFVFARNGVWRISGNDNNSFSATSFSVTRLTSDGCSAGGSVVEASGAIFYFGESALYVIEKDRFGDWLVKDLSEPTIKTLYQSLPLHSKANSFGSYDRRNNSIRWLLAEPLEERQDFSELIFSLKFGVFTKNKVKVLEESKGPLSLGGGKFSLLTEEVVTSMGVPVTVGTQPVTVQSLSPDNALRLYYCNITRLYPTVQYSFGGYINTDTPYDWPSTQPTDSPAYLTTGFSTAGDSRMRKDVPYITTLFEVKDSSSCFFQTRWDWFNSGSSGKWTSPRQIYRPELLRANQDILTSKNRVRGRGKSLSFTLESEIGKPFHLYGWEHNLETTTDE